MNIIESIKKAREKGIEDDIILDEVKRQNPQKISLFGKIKERGITSTETLDQIINMMSPREDTSTTPKEENNNPKEETPSASNVEESKENDYYKEGEKERQEFLKRVEAKEKEENQ